MHELDVCVPVAVWGPREVQGVGARLYVSKLQGVTPDLLDSIVHLRPRAMMGHAGLHMVTLHVKALPAFATALPVDEESSKAFTLGEAPPSMCLRPLAGPAIRASSVSRAVSMESKTNSSAHCAWRRDLRQLEAAGGQSTLLIGNPVRVSVEDKGCMTLQVWG